MAKRLVSGTQSFVSYLQCKTQVTLNKRKSIVGSRKVGESYEELCLLNHYIHHITGYISPLHARNLIVFLGGPGGGAGAFSALDELSL